MCQIPGILRLLALLFVLGLPVTVQAKILSDGSFTHQIPIKTPGGTAGLKPHLALVLHSGVQNGLCGVGCNLSGLSKITRTPLDSGVTYQGNDAFKAPEGRLIDISASKQTYHTENESWNRYQPAGTCGSGPCSWTKTAPDGVRYYFGSTEAGRVRRGGGTDGPVRVYALDRVEDMWGNYYVIEYFSNTHWANQYPKRIAYTLGNGRAGASQNQVEFVFESRPDHRAHFTDGSFVDLDQRLSQVRVKVGNNLLRTYVLAYELSGDSGRSRLKTITELGPDQNSIISQQTLTWSDVLSAPVPQKAALTDFLPNLTADDHKVHTGDFNGDGRTDLLVARNMDQAPDLYLAGSGGSFVKSSFDFIAAGTHVKDWNPANKNLMVTDKNGDGLDDLVLQGRSQSVGGYSLNDTLYLEADASGGFKTAKMIGFEGGTTNEDWFSDINRVILMDYNGDGVQDKLFFPSQPFRGLKTYLSKGDGTWAVGGIPAFSTGSAALAPTPQYRLIPADVNDDGRVDLLFQPPTAGEPAWLSLMADTGPAAPQPATDLYGLNATLWSAANYRILQVDVNGDHKRDLLFQPLRPGMTAHLALNRGQGFGAPSDVTNAWGLNASLWSASGYDLVQADIEGDGRADLILIAKSPTQSSYYLRGGVAAPFEAAVPLDGKHGLTKADWSSANHFLNIGDYNNDGATDLMLLGKGGRSSLFVKGIAGNQDALVGLDNGIGGTTTVTYQPIVDHDGAIQASGAHGIPAKRFRYLAVSESQSNGRGQTRTTAYRFANGRMQPGSRLTVENLGFEKITKTQVETGLKTVTVQRQDAPFHGRTDRKSIFDFQNQLIRDRHFKYERVMVHAGVFHLRELESETRTFENAMRSGLYLRTQKYGAYGEVLESRDCADGHCRVTSTQYQQDTLNWRLNLPLQVEVRQNGILLQAARYKYQDNRLTSQEQYLCAESSTCVMGGGRWITQIDSITYDSSGNVLAQADALGQVSKTEWDPIFDRLPTAKINPLGHRTSTSYDELGRPISSTDPNGLETRMQYGGDGRLAAILTPSGGKVLKTYYDSGDPTTQYRREARLTDSVGGTERFLVTTHYFDGWGQEFKTIQTGDDGLIHVLRKNTLAPGRSIDKKSLPHYAGDTPRWITNTRDSLGRLIKTEQPDGTVESTTYGVKKSVHQKASGLTETRTFGPRGEQLTLTDTGGGVTRFTYDEAGRKVRITMPDGRRIAQAFDSLGHMVRMIDPSIGLMRYEFDALGRLVGMIDNMGRRTVTELDALGRPVKQTSADGQSITYTYDDPAIPYSVGQLTKITDQARVSEWTYGIHGKPVIESVRYHQLPAYFVKKWTYDLAGRVTSKTLPVYGPFPATVQSYSYSSGGNLAEVSVDGVPWVAFDQYLANGKIGRKRTFPGTSKEVAIYYQYNQLDRLSRVQATDSDLAAIQDLAYSYDNVGNITEIYDALPNSVPPHLASSSASNIPETQKFEYDELDRLTFAFGSYGQKDFRYDQAGNLVWFSGNRARKMVYEGNRLMAGSGLEVSYNGVGAITKKIMDGVEWDYAYNSRGHLIEVRRDGDIAQTMAYDFKGRRVARVVYGRGNANKLFGTFYPTDEMEVRIHNDQDKTVVTKLIKVPSGKIASFDEVFLSHQVSQTAGLLAYADRFDTNHPKGFALAVAYRGLAWLHRPETKQRLPWYVFIFLSTSLTLFFLAELFKTGPTPQGSRFHPVQRGLAFSMALVLIWVTGCNGSGSGSADSSASYESSGNPESPGSSDNTGTSAANSPAVVGTDQSASVPYVANKLFFHANHVQTASLVTDEQGKFFSRIRHLPYGEVHYPSSYGAESVTKQYASFTGQEMEHEIGLIYYKFRYYDPALGRFLSPDTVIPGNGQDSQGFNRYAYVLNNPIKYTDPTGHWPKPPKIISDPIGWTNDRKDDGLSWLNDRKDNGLSWFNDRKDGAISWLNDRKDGGLSWLNDRKDELIAQAEEAKNDAKANAEAAARLAAVAVTNPSAAYEQAITHTINATAAANQQVSQAARKLATESVATGVGLINDASQQATSYYHGGLQDLSYRYAESGIGDGIMQDPLLRQEWAWDALNVAGVGASLSFCGANALCGSTGIALSGYITGYGKAKIAQGKGEDESQQAGRDKGEKQRGDASRGYTAYHIGMGTAGGLDYFGAALEFAGF